MSTHSSQPARLVGRALAIVFAWTLLLFGFAACQAEHSLLGGDCAPSYVACDGRCVAALTAPRRCNGCEGTCEVGATCDDGVCSGGSTEGDAADDGSTSDAALTEAGTDASAPGDAGELDAADACPPPPYDKPSSCGACGVVCSAPESACLADGAGVFACRLPCASPLAVCHGRCVDLQVDPENCGVCGKFCPSNLCASGACQGSTLGDIVVIGHDYQSAASTSSQAKILTNAVFIPRSDPLRILSYEQLASPSAVAHAKSLIQAAALGRTVVFTVRSDPSALVSATLGQSFDVVLLHDQVNGSAPALSAMGTSWNASLATFAKGGGVVVALDGAGGQGNMPSLLTTAGLLDVAGHTSLPPGTAVSVVAPADRVGTLVVSPYGTYANSASFQSNEPEGGNLVFVARKLTGNVVGDPVVVHKLVP